MIKTISVLGCGWLGFPLASRLVSKGYQVKGSTTTKDKFDRFRNQGIIPYLIDIDLTQQANFQDFLKSDVVVITVPFRRQLEDPFEYYQQIQQIITNSFTTHSQPWFIFTSSTAVYPSDGNQWDESMKIQPSTAREKALLATEEMIIKVKGTVVRLGGLYGPDREIHRFFLKKTMLKSAQGRMNLIHLTDCVNVLELIIQRQLREEIFNVVSDDHPTREQLYTHLSLKYGVPMPVFDAQDRQAKSKIVANDKIKRMLEYKFVVPTPMEN